MKKITSIILSSISVLLLVSQSSCKKLSSYDYPASDGSAYELIKADLNFSYFRYIVDKARLADTLNGKGEFTVFTPTNGAFISSGYTLALLQLMPMDSVTMLVKNHIIPGKVDVKNVTVAQTSLNNSQITLQKVADSYYADGGDITNPNQPTTNGFVNVINKVLVTKNTLTEAISSYVNATANSQLTFLTAAITRASTGSTNFTNLLSGSTPYTFFAPNNNAFIDGGYATIAAVQAAAPDVLGNLLKYQLIAGANLTTAFDSVPVKSFNGVNIYFDKIKPVQTTFWYANGILFGNVGSPNIMGKNGVVHTVSRFLPAPISTTTLDRIQSDTTLSMFYALIIRASTADVNFNFQKMLSDMSASYTVFAVNNAGLRAAGYANVAAINAEKPAVLADVLKLHLINKRLNNINIVENGTANTLLKIDNTSGTTSYDQLTFTMTGGYKVKGPSNVTSVVVIAGNIVTANGLLNIIGSLLQP